MNSIISENNLNEFLECIGYPCRSVLSIKNTKKFNDLEIKHIFNKSSLKEKFFGLHTTQFHGSIKQKR